jgi:cell wall-associated NlpC family hydrolase
VGLVHWAYGQVGVAVPESAPELAQTLPRVSGATPQGAHLLPGDILLFQNTAWMGYSHASIYLGNEEMISADSPEAGVRVERFDTSYWAGHWAGAVRVPSLVQDVA